MLLSSKRSRKRVRRTRTSIENSSRVPGRPVKPPCELVPSRKKLKAEARRVYDQHSASPNMTSFELSPLERLPVEIIQHIFFDALEVNLANVSQTLNRALSQESIYHALILFAYFDDDGRHPVEHRHFRPAQFRRISLEDRLQLQVGILKCRWCTLGRIKSCMPTLGRLVMVQAWHEERDFEQKTFHDLLQGRDRAPQEMIRVPNEDLLQIAPLPQLDDELEMQQHFSVALSSVYYSQLGEDQVVGPVSANGFLPFIQCWDYFPIVPDNPDGLVHKIVGYARAALGAMVVPDKLLEGSPWTRQKLEFLQLLRQGLRYRRHSDFIILRASAMIKGMESAITEGNVMILRVLVELHERIASLYQDGPDLDRNYERILTTEEDSNPSLDALPPQLFHLATKQGSNGSALLSLLIRVSWRSVHPDDPILTGWALRAAAKGDPIGRWLRKYMAGEYGEDFRQRPVFINGAVSWRLREEDYPFPEKSFTEEVGYIHDHAADKPMRRWPG